MLGDYRAQYVNAICVCRIDPRQWRYSYVIVTKVTEIIDASPVIKAIIIPFLRTIDESET